LYNYFNNNINNNNSSQLDMKYSDYYQQVANGNVKDATFVGTDSITGSFVKAVQGKNQYHVNQLPYSDNCLPPSDTSQSKPCLTQLLLNKGVKVIAQVPPDNSLWLNLLIGILPWALLLGLIFFFSRRASQGQQGIFSFGKSRAKLILEDRPS